MFPHFANPAALWALLAVPAIVAVHFLHRRPRERVTATLFLLETLLPEDQGGRVWARLRTSRAFWLQLAAALLLAWVLAQPVWPREGSHATVVFVLDESADMQPFRQEATRAVENDMQACAQQGVPLTWILMGSRPAAQPFYQGNDAREALKRLETFWQPRAATHDFHPALRAASTLAGRSGLTRLVTCRPERVPPGQSARGVGKPLSNSGFAGVTPVPEDGENQWRIAVKNNAPAAASPSITTRAGTAAKPSEITLPPIEPGGMAEFTFSMPAGCERATLQLPPDSFDADNALILVRDSPKPVSVRMQLSGQREALLKKLVASLPGFFLAGAPSSQASSRPASAQVTFTANIEEAGEGGAVLFADGKEPGNAPPDTASPIASAVVAAERHPLVEGLNWSGLLIQSPGSLTPGKNASVLLWRGSAPLAWLQEGRLFINWRWQASNAGRIPAPLLMIRRYLQSVQQNAPGTVTGNLPGGSLLPLPAGSRYTLDLPGGERHEGTCAGRLPEQTGLVTVLPPQPGAAPLFHGGIWLADARMGDFSTCRSFETGLGAFSIATRRLMSGDPFAPLWLALAGLALLASWLPPRPHRP